MTLAAQEQQTQQDTEFKNRLGQLADLLNEVESIANPTDRERTGKIIQNLLDFHGAGLSAILTHLGGAGETGQRVLDALAGDELVSSLFILYGLHPLDLPTRVGLALEKVRPYLASHGGNVKLLSVSDQGVVTLQMQGSCHGCPSSAVTMKTSIEEAIYEKAPDVTAIQLQEIEQPANHSPQSLPASGFVPLQRLSIGKSKSHLPQGALT